MEHQNILNLLNKPNDSRFVTKNIKVSMTNQMQIMMKEIKFSIKQKY